MLKEAVLDPDFDAIIGLAYPAMAEMPQPVMDNIMEQGLLDKNIFSFFMATNENETSELLFGNYDEDKFEGSLQWHPVIDKLFWSLKLDDIKYNGTSLGLCNDKKCMVTPDSGTTLMTTPSWAQKAFKNAMP